MTSSFVLLQDVIIPEDVTDKVYKYLFNYEGDRLNDERRLSSSSNESTASVDPEKPAGAKEWTPYLEQERPKDDDFDSEFWLTQCLISTYSSLEYILLCRDHRWALLWRKASDEHTFDGVTLKSIENKRDEEQCHITQCCLFGLGSSRQTELVDSIIVAIGTSTGSVIFYTENGKMLFEEQFAVNAPIIQLSMDYSEDGQLFTVITEFDIYAINAFSLHSTLLQSKFTIAKGEKNATEISESIELELTRFKIEDKATIKNAIFTGMQQPSSFDQYVKASMEDFNSVVDRAAPNYSTFFVHTNKMFATFSWYPEGEDSNLWTDTVSKLANTLMPSFPHFGIRKFLGIKHGPARKSALSRVRHTLVNRSKLNDNRQILRMIKAPRPRPWIAIVDNLARVLIMDWKMRNVMRWFKGYRDAQVAFVTSSHEGVSVIFLVIFVPRRSLLEVWPLMKGIRVAAITVDPNGMLLEGGTAAVICGKRELRQPSHAYFVDSQGIFHKIIVPYHMAFLEADNREHDQLILNQIASNEYKKDEFRELYTSLNEPSSKRQAFFKVLSNCRSDQLKELVEEVKKEENLKGFDDVQLKGFMQLLNRVMGVLKAYEILAESMENRPINNENLEISLSKDNIELVKRHLEIGNESDPVFPLADCLLGYIEWTLEQTPILEKNIPDIDLLQICRIIFEPIFTRNMAIDVFLDQVVSKLPFSEEIIASLFSYYILHGKDKIGSKFMAIVTFLEHLAKDDEEFLEKVEKNAVECTNVSRGILLSAAICIVKRNIQIEKQKKEDESDEETKNMEEQLEWEALNPTMEHYDCTLLAMHTVWLLSSIRNNVTYSKMLYTGAGYYREQIATWVAEKRLTLEEFKESSNESIQLAELFSLLPKVLENDFLLADIGWELVSYWFKAKLDNTEFLKESIRFIEGIKNNRLRHGVAKLIWEKFLLESVKAFSNIIEKTGRSPKDREAQNHLQMHERHLETFLECCCRILDILWRSVRDLYVISNAAVDHFLEIAFSHSPSCVTKIGTGRDSLVHISAVQQAVNYHLVIHHLHLLKVYILVLRLGLRIRPLSTVFCAIGQRAFFHPLDSHPLIPLEKVDDGTLENRHKFLSKVVESGSEEERKMAREMANEWALTVDQIALVEVVAHFRQGDDLAGSRELSSITSTLVGSKLAKLLAARIIRLADVKKAVLTATHLRVLEEVAGIEQGKVEWNGDWLEGVESLARVMKSLSLQPEQTTRFVKIMSIATQYFGISS